MVVTIINYLSYKIMKHWKVGETCFGDNGLILKGDNERILAAVKTDQGIKLVEQCDECFYKYYTPDEIVELANELIEWAKRNNMIKDKIEELLKICRDRNEIEFLYQLTKLFADVDGVGSILNGLPGSSDYGREEFNNAEKHPGNGEGYYCEYMERGAIYFYELYLKQIGVL